MQRRKLAAGIHRSIHPSGHGQHLVQHLHRVRGRTRPGSALVQAGSLHTRRPIIPFPGDFWYHMTHRYHGRLCGQCHGRIQGPCSSRASARMHNATVSFCHSCWRHYPTRRWIGALLDIAGNSQLGAILSVGPLAMRIANLLVVDNTGTEMYCATCNIWLSGPMAAELHFRSQMHHHHFCLHT